TSLAASDRRPGSGTALGALSKEMKRLLQRGDVGRRYKSRSEVVQALALGFVNAGLDCADLLRALLDGRNVGGNKLRELTAKRGPAYASRYVVSTWKKASDFARRRPAVADHEAATVALARIDAAIELSKWPGRRGAI